MLGENHIENNLQLGDPFIRLELSIFLLILFGITPESRDCVSINFVIAASELNLLLIDTTAMDYGL